MTARRPGSQAIGDACERRGRQDRRGQNARPAGDQAARWPRKPIRAASRVSGYEGPELLRRPRLLIESGADVPLRRHRLPDDAAGPMPTASGWRRSGVHGPVPRLARAGHGRDARTSQPDLAIGTTPVVQKAKAAAIPALYFTNLISARPLMGPAGAGALAQVINAAIGQQGPLRPRCSDSSRVSATGAAGRGLGDRHARRTATSFQRRPQAQVLELECGQARAARRWSSDLMLRASTTTGPAATGARSTPSPRSKGLQVIIDGPVGCENLPVTSVLHYTDALPPHELPIVVTGLVEEELGQRRHRRRDAARPADARSPTAARRRHRLDRRDDRRRRDAARAPASSASCRAPSTRTSGSSADRALYWLWTEFGSRSKPMPCAEAAQGGREARASTSSAHATARSTWPADLAEIRRLVEGIGAEVNHDASRSAAIWPTSAEAGQCRTPTSACTANCGSLLRGARRP